MARKKAIKPAHALNQTRTNRRIKFKLGAEPSVSVALIAVLVAASLALLSSSLWLPSGSISVEPPTTECFDVCDPSSTDVSSITASKLFLIYSVCQCSESNLVGVEEAAAALAADEEGYKASGSALAVSVSSSYYVVTAGGRRPANMVATIKSLFNNATGGFSQRNGMVATLTSTIHALSLLNSVEGAISAEEMYKAHEFIRECVHPDGSFTDLKYNSYAEPSVDLALLFLHYFDGLPADKRGNLPPPATTRSFVRFCLLQLSVSPASLESHYFARGVSHFGSSLPSVALLRAVGLVLLLAVSPYLYFSSQLPPLHSSTLAYVACVFATTIVLWLPASLKSLVIVPLGGALLLLLYRLGSAYSKVSFDMLENTILLALGSAALNTSAIVGLNILMPDVASLSNPGLLYLVVLVHPFPYILVHYAVGALLGFRRVEIHRTSALTSHLVCMLALSLWFLSRPHSGVALRVLAVRGHASVALFSLPVLLLLVSEGAAMFGLSLI